MQNVGCGESVRIAIQLGRPPPSDCRLVAELEGAKPTNLAFFAELMIFTDKKEKPLNMLLLSGLKWWL